MTIEVPPEELYAMAEKMRDAAELATEAHLHVHDVRVGGPLQPAVEDLVTVVRAATGGLADQLDWLGSTISSIAQSWSDLDGALLVPRGQARPR